MRPTLGLRRSTHVIIPASGPWRAAESFHRGRRRDRLYQRAGTPDRHRTLARTGLGAGAALAAGGPSLAGHASPVGQAGRGAAAGALSADRARPRWLDMS